MRKAFKVILIIVGIILFLVIGAVVYLNTPWGQNFVRSKAEAFLRNKLKTELHIGHLGYGLPKFIVLEDVLFLDQAKDTLLAVGELKIDINMLQLLHKEVDVQQVVLRGVHSHIYRNQPDTTFNFSYIIDAFASKKPKDPNKVKDTSSSPSLKIDLDRVKLDDIHVRFDDHTGGTLLVLNLDHLDLKMNKLDLEKMLFHIKDLSVAGLQTSFTQDTSYLPIHPKDTTKTAKLQLIADNVQLERVAVNYNDVLNKFLFGLKLGGLQLQLNRFGLDDNVVDVKKLAINNTDIALVMGKHSTAPSPIDTIVKIDSTEGWHVKAANVDLAGINFKMDNENEVRQPKGIDYAHLDVQRLALSLRDVLYTSDSLRGDLKHLAVKEQSGVDVKELRTVFHYNSQGAALKNLYLQTDNTILQNHLEVHYPSLADLKKNMQAMQLKVNVENSIIGIKDLLIFAPDLEKQELFRKYKNGNVRLATTASGYLNNLNIAKFYLAGMDNTEVVMNGRLSGLPEPKQISYNLNIARLQSSRNDIAALVPDSVLAAIRIPDKFGITGQVAGTISDYKTDLYLASTDGVAYIKGSLAMSPGKGKEKYDMMVKTGALNLGRILKKDSLMGEVTATITAKGQSFDVKTMNAVVVGDVGSALLKGYRYHDIKLTGKVAGKKGDLDFISVDSNLQMHLTGNADFNGKYPAVKADIQLDSIDFRALKLYATELRARGTIHADFPVLNPDYPEGVFVWWKPVINANGLRYYLDSMYVTSKPTAERGQNITANLDVLYATITGKTPLTQIGPIIQEHINRHYTFPKSDSAKKSLAATKAGPTNTKDSANTKQPLPTDYDLKIMAQVIDKPMLHGILPGLTSFDSIHLNASLTPALLSLNVLIPEVVYGTMAIENGVVKVNGVDSAFTYKVTADKISQGQFQLWYADIHGDLDQDKITTNISLSDQQHKEQFLLGASLQKIGDSQIVQLAPGLKLNYRDWTVAQPNRIVLAGGGFYIRNFGISNNGQSITANSNEPRINTPLKIDVNNFLLSNVTEAISKEDTLLAGGVLSGTVLIEKMTPSLVMTSDLEIKQLSVLGDTLGNLAVHVNNKQENTLDAKISLKGNGNDIGVAGSYYLKTNKGNDFNLNVDVNALSLKSFESIAQNQIRNSSGFIRGKLAVTGTAAAPKIDGTLRTDNLKTNITQLNATFKMPAEKIEFTGNGLSFNNFTIYDTANNKAVFNGTVDMKVISDPQLDMNINAKNWRALHSTAKDNKVFYGDLLLTTNINLKGSAVAPTVDGDIKILKGTDVTVITPESKPQLQETRGIVVFVNMKDTGRRNVLVPQKKKPVVKRKVTPNSSFNVNVTVDKEAQFSLVLDQASGDFLSVKGDATLNAAMTKSGTLSLTGSYALQGGSYQLNYNFIKRKFLIRKGSTITFAGDPINGTTLDLTAIYEAQVSAYDLVQRQVTDMAQLNYYKQRLPFEVELHMHGPVMKPYLTFDVALPENKTYRLSQDQVQLIQGKLSQIRTDTSELNKQVFAVLILNRFVSDDPFSSGASSSASFTALQSVSTFIGEQLNQAAGKLIKGVDFAVDLGTTEDYTTGDMRRRTDLNLAASKRLLNDRLKLTIGNNFELEGPQTTNTSQSALIPTNLAADYQLSADGKYTVRAYRRAYDQGVLQGFVTETGVNFIVSLDYNNLKKALKTRRPKKDTANSRKN